VDGVSAIVLAYGAEDWLERCVEALLGSAGVEVEVVLVDNGCTGPAVDRLDGRDGVTVVRPGANLGFAAGGNLGAAKAAHELLAFVNSDCVVEPHALQRLASVARRPEVGIASASVRLAEDPALLNSAGNPIHFLGLSWAGAYGERADAHPVSGPVTGASGATMALRGEVWRRLGGFEERFFMYHDDTDLSWRCWQQGLQVVYVPDAVSVHRYEFSRNPRKYYLLERNRLLFVLTLFQGRTLLLIAPALAAFELAVLLLAALQGWGRQKLAGLGWIVRHAGWVRRRRRWAQAHRTVPDRALAPLLTGRFDAGNLELPAVLAGFDALLGVYWRAVVRLL
jgi:GT2 family glycosyltransferase